jgi:hypothetical protein
MPAFARAWSLQKQMLRPTRQANSYRMAGPSIGRTARSYSALKCGRRIDEAAAFFQRVAAAVETIDFISNECCDIPLDDARSTRSERLRRYWKAKPLL